jgi:hypothetical protein
MNRLLNLIGSVPSIVQVKGSWKYFNPTEIKITCNYDPLEFCSRFYPADDIIQNPHVKVDGNKTTFVTQPLVRHSNTFKSNKKKDLYPKQKMNSENRPLPLDQYRGMTQIQRYILIK